MSGVRLADDEERQLAVLRVLHEELLQELKIVRAVSD
jgi:hypothetical protein